MNKRPAPRAPLAAALAALALCLLAPGASAAEGRPTRRPSQEQRQTRARRHRPTRVEDASRRARRAADAFDQIMHVRDRAIPRELLADAEAVAVFPGVLKGAFIVGGRRGQGVVSRRTAGGWSAPAFYNMSGASVGAQIGGARTDYVLLVMNEDGLKGLLEDKFEVGGEAGVAAGPVGRVISASTTPTLDAGILSYSRSKGVFVGAALKGIAITPDNHLNRAYYGKTARDVLTDGTRPPTHVRSFTLALSRYSVRRAPAAQK